MNDRYRLTDTPHRTAEEAVTAGATHPREAPSAGVPFADVVPPTKDRLTGLLWVALAICVGLNALMSIVSPDNLVPSIAAGVAGLGCIGLLVSRYLERRHS